MSDEEPPRKRGGGRSRSRLPGTPRLRRQNQPRPLAQEPARQYVEVDDPDNRYVRVQVDGEDVEVPYSEVVKGYSREADFTRKTQAVAQSAPEAEYGLRLQQALQANPQLTLQILAEQHGRSQPTAGAAEPEPEAEYADPLERMVARGAAGPPRTGATPRRNGKLTSSWSRPSVGCEPSSTERRGPSEK